jgi:subtilase family serine protease
MHLIVGFVPYIYHRAVQKYLKEVPGNYGGILCAMKQTTLLLLLPALIFLAIESFAASSRVKADLFIEDVQLTPSRPTQLRVRVANQGLLAATQTEMQVYIEGSNGTEEITAPVPLLKAGDRQWLVIYVGSTVAEARVLTLHIDQPSLIDELDEQNNVFVLE